MIVKKLEDVVGTKGDAHGNKWHSLRLLHAEDDMGVTVTDSILEVGFQMDFWQKNHLEACYCLEGESTLEELDNGTVHEIRPGTLYAMNDHDRHRIRAMTRMRVVCTFFPALIGDEARDADGSLCPPQTVASPRHPNVCSRSKCKLWPQSRFDCFTFGCRQVFSNSGNYRLRVQLVFSKWTDRSVVTGTAP